MNTTTAPFAAAPVRAASPVGPASAAVDNTRLDYLDALSVLTHASGILLLGSSERHYTASKLYPALLARRPLLALFHEARAAA